MRDAMTQARLAWLGRDRTPTPEVAGKRSPMGQETGSPPSPQIPELRLQRVLAAIERDTEVCTKREATVCGLETTLTMTYGSEAVKSVGLNPRALTGTVEADLPSRLRHALSVPEPVLHRRHGIFVLRGLIIGLLLSRSLEQVANLTELAARPFPKTAQEAQNIIESL